MVVGHLGVNLVNPDGDHAVYVLGAPGAIAPLRFGIHLAGEPEAFAPRLREIVAEVDRSLILADPVPLSDVYQGDWYLMLLVSGGLALLVVFLVALAASGIYAMMSFSVSERTREIGIRTALGAKRMGLVMTVARRSLMQIGIGALVGLPLAARLFYELHTVSEGRPSAVGSVAAGLALAAAVVTVVALFSCVAPVRRALSIQPNEALRGAD